jgi:hypothetical protein
MNAYQAIPTTYEDRRTDARVAVNTHGKLSSRMLWFGSLYLGSMSLLVSIGGSMRLLLTHF